MILPIHVYGDPILREETTPVEGDSPEVQQLVDDMIETMRAAEGIGLAAPQVGRTERLFVVDLNPVREKIEPGAVPPELIDEPIVFINPELFDPDGPDVEYEEGCLSIPDVSDIVERPDVIHVRYLDRTFAPQTLEVRGMAARVVQHEFDHLNGVLFIDHLRPFRRRLLKRRLREIARGRVEADYALALPTHR